MAHTPYSFPGLRSETISRTRANDSDRQQTGSLLSRNLLRMPRHPQFVGLREVCTCGVSAQTEVYWMKSKGWSSPPEASAPSSPTAVTMTTVEGRLIIRNLLVMRTTRKKLKQTNICRRRYFWMGPRPTNVTTDLELQRDAVSITDSRQPRGTHQRDDTLTSTTETEYTHARSACPPGGAE